LGAGIVVGDSTITPVVEQRGVEMNLGDVRLGAHRARVSAVRVTIDDDVTHVAVPDRSRWTRIGMLLSLIAIVITRRNR
jgi:hypothetical protein